MSGFFGASGSGLDFTALGKVCAALPRANSTTVDYIGFNPAVMGSFTARTMSTASYLASIRRVGFDTTTTINTARGFLSTGGGFVHMGASSTQGGFKFLGTLGIDTKVATGSMFVGLAPAVTWGGSDVVGNKTDIIGLGADSGDTNWQIFHNDASGAATKADLGASFPFSNGTDMQLELDCDPGGSSVSYTVTRLDTMAEASGTISTNLPANTTLVTPFMWCSNLGTASSFQVSTHGMMAFDKQGQ